MIPAPSACLRVFVLLLLLACAGGTPSWAQSGKGNPYEAVVDVEDDSDASRRKGLRAALILVLKRVVGRYDPASGSVLDRAESFVQQYQFVYGPDEGDAQGAAGGTSGEASGDAASEKVRLRAVFDAEAVSAALKGAGLPVFGIDPRLVDAWIVEVSGLRSASDYARVCQLFEGTSGVRRLEVAQLEGDVVRLRMIVEGGLERANQLMLSRGVVRQQGEGRYVFAAN